MKWAFLWFSLVGLLATGLVAHADVDTLSETCNGCHGNQGVSRWDDVPSIGGIDAFSQSEALYAYRDNARPCADSEFRQGDTSRTATNMCEVSADLTDTQVEALAEHYAALPFVPAEQPFDAALAEAGKAVHEGHCTKCHSDGGSDPEDEASILAGQHTGYLKRSFEEYRSGERWQTDKMKEQIDKLAPADIEALINYYASQR